MKPLSTDVTKNPRSKWSLRFQNLTRIIGLALPFWFLPQPMFLGTAGLNQDGAKASATRQTSKASRDLLEVKVPNFSAVGQTITLRARGNQYYSLTLVSRGDVEIKPRNLRGVFTSSMGKTVVATCSEIYLFNLESNGWTVTSQQNPQDGTTLVTPQGLVNVHTRQGQLNLEIGKLQGRVVRASVPAEEGSQVTDATWQSYQNGIWLVFELTAGNGNQSWQAIFVDPQTSRFTVHEFNSQNGWTKHVDTDSNVVRLENGTSSVSLGFATPPAVINFIHQINTPYNLSLKFVPTMNKTTQDKTITGVIGAEVQEVSDGHLRVQVILLRLTLNPEYLQNAPWQDSTNWPGPLLTPTEVANASIRVEIWEAEREDSVVGLLSRDFLGNSFASLEDFEEELRKAFENYELVIEKKVADEDYVYYKLEFNSPSNSYSIGIYRTDQGWVVGDVSQNRSEH